MGMLQLHASVYLLQVYQMTDFWKKKGDTGKEAIIFGVGFAVAVSILIIINIINKKYNIPALSGTGSASSGSASRRYSGFVLRRLAHEIGLNRKQTKMLDFVFRTDNVANPRLSLNTPALLEQHFKRAYRVIDSTSTADTELQERLSMLFAVRNILESNTGGANITSTRQLPDNIAATLNAGGEGQYPVRVLSAKGGYMLVENPKKASGSPIRLAQGTKVTLSIFGDTNSGFSVASRILGLSESKKGPVLQLVHSSQIQRLSQRRFRRRQAVIASNFYLVYVEGKRMVVDKKRSSGNILDISTGGCSIKTNTPVSSGARLKIEGSLGKMPVTALGQVLRINRSGISAIMHIKFLKIPRKSLNVINAYVYEYSD